MIIHNYYYYDNNNYYYYYDNNNYYYYDNNNYIRRGEKEGCVYPSQSMIRFVERMSDAICPLIFSIIWRGSAADA